MLFKWRPCFVSRLWVWRNRSSLDFLWYFRLPLLLLFSSVHFMNCSFCRFASFSNSKFLRLYRLSFFSCCLPVINVLKIRRSHWVSILMQIDLLLLPCTLFQNFSINQSSLLQRVRSDWSHLFLIILRLWAVNLLLKILSFLIDFTYRFHRIYCV